jgi:hypothetical protein
MLVDKDGESQSEPEDDESSHKNLSVSADVGEPRSR